MNRLYVVRITTLSGTPYYPHSLFYSKNSVLEYVSRYRKKVPQEENGYSRTEREKWVLEDGESIDILVFDRSMNTEEINGALETPDYNFEYLQYKGG